LPAVDPTPEQFARLAKTPDAGPIVMINLLSFRQPDGLASYERYGAAVQACLDAVGGTPVYVGAGLQQVVGDGERPWWDAIAVVRYPAVSAFITMVASPEYQAIGHLRTEALERAELIATRPDALSA
jgi:uncharacterized protein (DUF1330 family)